MDNFKIDGLTIKEHLLRFSEYGKKEFCMTLNPGVENVLGIRMGDLRYLANRIAKADWKQYLAEADTCYMEERTLQGLVLGSIRLEEDIETYLERVTRFVRIINSWSVCDAFKFAGGKRFIAEHSERLWQYLCHWMTERDITPLLSSYGEIHRNEYYVRMAVAWALSECFVKFPQETLSCLKTKISDDFTYRKALQKILESYRVDNATKNMIRSMRRCR